MPAEPFETGLTLTPRVDRYAQVTVRQCHYSVPARLIGHRVRVRAARLGAAWCSTADGWSPGMNGCDRAGRPGLELDHYLEVLVRKPGALPGATALAQARASGRVHRRP